MTSSPLKKLLLALAALFATPAAAEEPENTGVDLSLQDPGETIFDYDARAEIAIYAGTTPIGSNNRRVESKLRPHFRPFLAGLQIADDRSFLRISRGVLRQDYQPEGQGNVELRSNLWYVLAGPTFSNETLELALGGGAYTAMEQRIVDNGDIEDFDDKVDSIDNEPVEQKARSMGLVSHIRGSARLLQTAIGDLKLAVLYETYYAGSSAGEFRPRAVRHTLPVLEIMWADLF